MLSSLFWARGCVARLDLQFGDASVGDCWDAVPEINVITWGQFVWTQVKKVNFSLSLGA